MQLLYFASVREAIGKDSEEIDLPTDITTIAECTRWLVARDTRYTVAFSQPEKLRFALDQEMAPPGATIGNAKELAIFPPVTGG